MSTTKIEFPYAYMPLFASGKPVSGGNVYIGVADLDPEVPANQITVYFAQEDGNIVTGSQPITLSSGGVPTYNGSPVGVRIDPGLDYAIKILSSTGAQVYYSPSNEVGSTGEVTANVDTVADLQAASFDDGLFYGTHGYYSVADGGGGLYYIKTSAQASSDGDIVDEYVNHTLANGNIAVLQLENDEIHYKQAGIRGGGYSNDSLAFAAAIAHQKYLYVGEEGNIINFDNILDELTYFKLRGSATLRRADDPSETRNTESMLYLTGVEQVDLDNVKWDFNYLNAYDPPSHTPFSAVGIDVRLVVSERLTADNTAPVDKWFYWNDGYITGGRYTAFQLIVGDLATQVKPGFHTITVNNLVLDNCCSENGFFLRGPHEYVFVGDVVIEDPIERVINAGKSFAWSCEVSGGVEGKLFEVGTVTSRWVASSICFAQAITNVNWGDITMIDTYYKRDGTDTTNPTASLVKIDHALATITDRTVRIKSFVTQNTNIANPNVTFNTGVWIDEGNQLDSVIGHIQTDLDVNLGGSNTTGVSSYRNHVIQADIIGPGNFQMAPGCTVDRLGLFNNGDQPDVQIREGCKINSISSDGGVATITLLPVTTADPMPIMISDGRLDTDVLIDYLRAEASGNYLDLRLNNVVGCDIRFRPTSGTNYSDFWSGTRLTMDSCRVRAQDANSYTVLANTEDDATAEQHMVTDTVVYRNTEDGTSDLPLLIPSVSVETMTVTGQVNLRSRKNVIDTAGFTLTQINQGRINSLVYIINETGSITNGANLVTLSGGNIAGAANQVTVWFIMSSSKAVQIQ